MIYFIKKITNSDKEFLSIMMFLNNCVKDTQRRNLYIPEFSFYPDIKRKYHLMNSRNTFDEKELYKIFKEFDNEYADDKINKFLYNLGGKVIYVPTISNIYKIIRNTHIKTLVNLGASYHELEECFNLSQIGIRRIYNTSTSIIEKQTNRYIL